MKETHLNPLNFSYKQIKAKNTALKTTYITYKIINNFKIIKKFI